MQNLIPLPDILPLPAPVWLFVSLLILTFTVHIVFMNLVLGGTFLALVSNILGRKDPKHERLAKTAFEFMPVNIAIAVNFGVAPLLFVQVLYGNLMYSSSILMALAWFGVIVFLIFGYYGTYTLRYRWNKLGSFRLPLNFLVAGLFLSIAFFFVNNLSLMQHPQKFVEHFFKDPAWGTLNWGDPTMYPRYLHMVFGALAVCSIWFMFIGARGKTGDNEWSGWVLRYSSRIFVITTLINIAVGLWFMLAAEDRIRWLFVGQDIGATIVFAVSVVLTVAALAVLWKVDQADNPGKKVLTGAGLMLGVLILMFIMRQYLRAAYLEPYFTLSSLEVVPQWGPLLTFMLTMVFLMIPITWYLVKVSMSMKDKPK